MTRKLIAQCDQRVLEIASRYMINLSNEIFCKWETIELDKPEISYKKYARIYGCEKDIPWRAVNTGVIQDIWKSNKDS